MHDERRGFARAATHLVQVQREIAGPNADYGVRICQLRGDAVQGETVGHVRAGRE